MNSDGPKPRFWQIHLSTAIVMSILIAGLAALNLGVIRGASWIGWPCHIYSPDLFRLNPLSVMCDVFVAANILLFTLAICEKTFRKLAAVCFIFGFPMFLVLWGLLTRW